MSPVSTTVRYVVRLQARSVPCVLGAFCSPYSLIPRTVILPNAIGTTKSAAASLPWGPTGGTVGMAWERRIDMQDALAAMDLRMRRRGVSSSTPQGPLSSMERWESSITSVVQWDHFIPIFPSLRATWALRCQSQHPYGALRRSSGTHHHGAIDRPSS